MNEAERSSYWERVTEAADDPVIAERLAMGLAAVETLVCGRPGSGATAAEPFFLAGFRLTPDELDLLIAATRRDGRDCVYVAYDLDEPAASPALVVLRPRGDEIVVDLGCRLWAAPGSGRAVIVTAPGTDEGCYAFRRGRRLAEAANSPAKDLSAGFRRADARMRAAASSREAQAEARDHGRRCLTECVAPGVLVHSRARLAA